MFCICDDPAACTPEREALLLQQLAPPPFDVCVDGLSEQFQAEIERAIMEKRLNACRWYGSWWVERAHLQEQLAARYNLADATAFTFIPSSAHLDWRQGCERLAEYYYLTSTGRL